jgi:hypothetical protein
MTLRAITRSGHLIVGPDNRNSKPDLLAGYSAVTFLTRQIKKVVKAAQC